MERLLNKWVFSTILVAFSEKPATKVPLRPRPQPEPPSPPNPETHAEVLQSHCVGSSSDVPGGFRSWPAAHDKRQPSLEFGVSYVAIAIGNRTLLLLFVCIIMSLTM